MRNSRKFRNRNKKKIESKYVLFLMTGICALVILASLTFNINGGPLNYVAGYVFVPMQKGINTIGGWISEKNNDFKTLGEVLAENKELKQQVDELTTKLNTTKLEQYELDNYKELLELDSKYPSYEKVAASVIAKDSGNWFSVFTIDKGKNAGIKEGMNVIAGSGLVGIVTEAGPNYAKVRCIIDDTSNVSGMISTTEDNCNVKGSLQEMTENKSIIFSELVDDDDEVKVGDPVVTSNISDRYLQGILIGYVASVEDNSNNLTKSGTITPVVDFAHLQNVFVIINVKDVSALENEKEAETETEAGTETETENSTEDKE